MAAQPIENGGESNVGREPESDVKTEWGTVEWSEFWGDELDTLMESFYGDIVKLESDQSYSVGVLMRALDPPDNRGISELIGAEKRELIKRAHEWAQLYPDILVEVVVNSGGTESVAAWGQRIRTGELVDIRFSHQEQAPEPVRKEKKTITKSIELKGACAFCHHVTDLKGTIKYLSGEQEGQITVDDQVYRAKYDRGLGWGITVDCICTTDVDKDNPGQHRKIIIKSKF